ncbi:YaaR family protein (plasmid) [Rossellomorea sp. AcN35-11]|nr:YaaR family protein [Rossellomorea aquimaris]WJV32217.1 YaaR family protein [Rossellomorea sp. AcN35-11]
MDIKTTLNKPISNTNIARNSNTYDKVKFHEIVAKETKKEASGRLNDLMMAIEEQGDKLGKNQSIDNLKRYKRQVKEFMAYVKKNAVRLENKEEFNGFGHSRSLSILRKVDEKLVEITDRVIKKESDSGLRVLELIGEVKGLLIDVLV